jgi:hypothetical protein
MADTVSDDSTGWVSFFNYCLERAKKMTPAKSDIRERLRSAVWETFWALHRYELEMRWYDDRGRERTGPLLMTTPVYVVSEDMIMDWSGDFGNAYRVRVRKRRRRGPVNRAADTTGELDAKPPTIDPTLRSDKASVGFDTRGEISHVAKSEPSDATEVSDAVPVIDSTKAPVPLQWPWEVKPDRVRPTSPRARCREDLARNFQPNEILHLEVPEVEAALVGKGCHYDDTTIQRALLRKQDEVNKPK